MRALPENIARGQSNDRACEVIADQGQYFQVKPKPNWLLFYLLTQLGYKNIEKFFSTSFSFFYFCFFFQAEDGIRDCLLSRGLGDVYKRQKRN